MKYEDVKIINQEIKELEISMEIQEGFFNNLLKSESDWSFIIKLHAFLEVGCTVLITKALGRDELTDVISRLEMSGKNFGKTMFISRLSLLSKGAINYIHKLSEIRNCYVHNLKNISLSLEDYVKIMDKNQRVNFVTSIGYDTVEDFKIGEKLIKKKDFILENPRIAIYVGAFSVLAELAVELKFRKLTLKEADLNKRAAELFISVFKKSRT